MSLPLRSALLPAFFLLTAQLFAQLDTIHWVPPMHARTGIGPQYLFLTTPEKDTFTVTIRDGAGTIVTNASISNSKPFQYYIGGSGDTKTLVPEALLHTVISDRGYVVDGKKKFYCNFRAHSDDTNQAGDLSCKGRAALGKIFRIGCVLQGEYDPPRRSNFVGIMATEDSTVIRLSDYDPNTKWHIGSSDVAQAAPISLVLNAGQSTVFSHYIFGNPYAYPPNGLMGALLESSKPVAVNSGSWLASPVTHDGHDIGIDQIVPVELVGREYIICKGNGSQVLEHPIVIAHENNTQVFINGGPTPVATLNAGKYLVLDITDFTPQNNLYIRTTKPAYLYQMVGGTTDSDNQYRTVGLIFVPPISCAIPNAVDNIYRPNSIGSISYDGGLMIVAMKDSMLTVRVDGQVVSMGAPQAVTGNPDFVTYRNLALFSESKPATVASIVAEGAVQVAMFGRNGAASYAAFYSGFSKTDRAKVSLKLVGDGVCPDTLFATGHFDGVQWVYEDSIMKYGPDTMFVAYAPGKYSVEAYLGVCRANDLAVDTLTATFKSPAFPYSFEEPTCFGFADGKVIFGLPYGGLEPYQFSVDNGGHFSKNNEIGQLRAGAYKLVVRDSTGCYNRPLDIEIGQPDTILVTLSITDQPVPLKPGGHVELLATPTRPVVSSQWFPSNNSGCGDCLTYGFNPQETTLIGVEVKDSLGCPARDTIWVYVTPNVFIPNAFAPNSGEGNDRFLLLSKEEVHVARIAIYDRWGEQVWENHDFMTNDWSQGWDGKFRGELALPGVYVFVAEIETLPGHLDFLRGEVTLIR